MTNLALVVHGMVMAQLKSGGMGKWESGEMGKWESGEMGIVGKWGNGAYFAWTRNTIFVFHALVC